MCLYILRRNQFSHQLFPAPCCWNRDLHMKSWRQGVRRPTRNKENNILGHVGERSNLNSNLFWHIYLQFGFIDQENGFDTGVVDNLGNCSSFHLHCCRQLYLLHGKLQPVSLTFFQIVSKNSLKSTQKIRRWADGERGLNKINLTNQLKKKKPFSSE